MRNHAVAGARGSGTVPCDGDRTGCDAADDERDGETGWDYADIVDADFSNADCRGTGGFAVATGGG